MIGHDDGDASRDWLAWLASSFVARLGPLDVVAPRTRGLSFCGRGRTSTKHHRVRSSCQACGLDF